jgi:copper chaperone CopZ
MWRHVAAVLLGTLVLGAALPANAGAGGDAVRTTFRVEGMHCDGCSATIVGTLERIDGVLSASADPAAVVLASEAGTATHLRDAAGLEAALARPDVIGGTAPVRVHAELASAARRLGLSG